MRDPRFRFSDAVRASTRAIALRMIHAGEVAQSAAQLHEWIMRTDDLRETLVNAGYGSAFTADDVFPLLQSFVAKASRPAVSRTGGSSSRALWVGAIITVVLAVVALGITIAVR